MAIEDKVIYLLYACPREDIKTTGNKKRILTNNILCFCGKYEIGHLLKMADMLNDKYYCKINIDRLTIEENSSALTNYVFLVSENIGSQVKFGSFSRFRADAVYKYELSKGNDVQMLFAQYFKRIRKDV